MAVEAGAAAADVDVPADLLRAVAALRARPTALTQMEPEDRAVLLDAIERHELRLSGLLAGTFPDAGPLARSGYPAHCELMAAGAWARVRGMIAANRSGKTMCGAFECAVHLTGRYPRWWKGRRFDGPVRVWAAGKTNDKVRDILQPYLLGEYKAARGLGSRVTGTGMVPHEDVVQGSLVPKSGVPGLIDTIKVRHQSGRGLSTLGVKSFQQGRQAFEGTGQHVVWLDEEPPMDVYNEAWTRLTTTRGLLLFTFTPLDGVSDVVKRFMPEVVESGALEAPPYDPVGEAEAEMVSAAERRRQAFLRALSAAEPGADRMAGVPALRWGLALSPQRYGLRLGGDGPIPHLTERMKAEAKAEWPRHEWPARTQGIPVLSEGRIYPYDSEMFVVPPARLEPWWRRCIALDPGWRFTGVAFLAHDTTRDVVRLYDEYLGRQAPARVHAGVVRARAPWSKGVVDPSARNRNIEDGRRLIEIYREAGLDVVEADRHTVESGIEEMADRITSGRLEVAAHCQHFLREYGWYRRDQFGRPVKGDDHLLDAVRYGVMSGLRVARTEAEAVRAGHGVGGAAWADDSGVVLDEVAGY